MANKLIPIEQKLMKYVVLDNGCWQWTGGKDRDGYGVFGHHRRKQVRAHRASYEFHVGPVSSDVFVCHKCDNPSCINPDHLFLGSPRDNTHDMIAKGRKNTTVGDAHGMAKLSHKDVVEIINSRKEGVLLTVLAERYGVTFQHISAIALNKHWRHV